MKNITKPAFWIRVVLLVSIANTYVNGLGIQGGGQNNWFEIIVDKHSLNNENEIRYLEVICLIYFYLYNT